MATTIAELKSGGGRKDAELLRIGDAPRAPRIEDWTIIFDMFAAGASIMDICLDLNLHKPTVETRIAENKELQDQYYLARARRGDAIAEKALSIADKLAGNEIEVPRGKAAAGIYQWAAAQLNPKDWGQSTIKQEITGKNGKDLELQQVVIFKLPDNERSGRGAPTPLNITHVQPDIIEQAEKEG